MDESTDAPQKTVWDDMSNEDLQKTLKDIQVETAAALNSGDAVLEKWARTTGAIATAVLDLFEGEDFGEKDKHSPTHSAGTDKQEKEKPSAVELETKPDKHTEPKK